MVVNMNGRIFDEEILTCPKCNTEARPNYKYVENNNSIQARCSECGAFIKNVKHTQTIPIELKESPSTKQINYIKSFYSSNRMPKSKYLATELISVMEKVRKEYELQ